MDINNETRIKIQAIYAVAYHRIPELLKMHGYTIITEFDIPGPEAKPSYLCTLTDGNLKSTAYFFDHEGKDIDLEFAPTFDKAIDNLYNAIIYASKIELHERNWNL